jgi:hypothetical protein
MIGVPHTNPVEQQACCPTVQKPAHLCPASMAAVPQQQPLCTGCVVRDKIIFVCVLRHTHTKTQVYYSEIVNLIVIFVNKYNRLK